MALMASAVLLVSCAMLEEHQEEAAGYLAAPSLEVDLEVDGTLLTKAFDFDVQEPEVSEITFVVRDKDNNVKYSGTGLWTDPLVLPVGSYSVEASYGTNGFDGPYFTGSAQGTIENNDQEVPALTMSLANALVRVRVGEDFGVHFSPGQEFSLKCGETSKDIETGDWTYIPAGDDVSIELSLAGTNSFADPVTFKYTLDGPSPKCAYDVVCTPDGQTSWPSIGAPKIEDNNVWACMAFITELPQSQNIPEDRKDEIVIEAIPTSGGNTLTAVKDGNNYVFNNLTPGVTYNVRARIGNLTSEATPMTPTVDGLTVSAEHTKNSAGELDGTDVTTSLSKSDLIKDAITTWDIDICRSDGTPLRSDLSLGTSDGSAITDVNGWPYLPTGNGESYVIKASAKTDGQTYTFDDIPVAGLSATGFTPTITLRETSYTSYDKYEGGYVDAANGCDPETLYSPSATIGGISENLRKNSNYTKTVTFSVGDKKSTTDAESMSTAIVEGANFTELSWGSHSLTATFTFDGVTSESASRVHHITGLPYAKDFSTDKDVSRWDLVHTQGGTHKCGYNTDKTDGYELAYGYTNRATCDFFSPVFVLPDGNEIYVSYDAMVTWWQTGTGVSNGSSYLNLGVTKGVEKKTDKNHKMSEASKTWESVVSSTTISVLDASLSNSGDRIVLYVNNQTWGDNSFTEHFVVLNKFSIRYRN